jgi:hypothetical protein
MILGTWMEEWFYTPTSEYFQKMRHKTFFRGFIRPQYPVNPNMFDPRLGRHRLGNWEVLWPNTTGVWFVAIVFSCLDIFGLPGTTCICNIRTRLQGGSHFLATISTLDEDENTQNKWEFWENMRSFGAKWEKQWETWEVWGWMTWKWKYIS